MRTLLHYSVAALASALAFGAPARAEGPELTYAASAAESALSDENRQEIDQYVQHWVDALASAAETDRITETCSRLLEGYNKYGSRAGEHHEAYAEAVAKYGKALLGGKLAADDSLAALKAVNFAIRIQRMAKVSLQPLAEAMVTNRNPAVRFFGWRTYATLRGPILATGGNAAKTMFASVSKAPASESDPFVLSEALNVCRMSPRPDPASGVDEVTHNAAQAEFLKALAQNWKAVCLQVMKVDAAASEAALTGVRALRLIKIGLAEQADAKQLLQLVANMAYAAGQAFDRALQMQEAAAAAQQATGMASEAEIVDPAEAKKLAEKFGMTLEQLAGAKGDVEQTVSANASLLAECEVAINVFTGKGEPGERHIRKELSSRGSPVERGAAVRLAILKWIAELQKDPGIKAPADELKSAPATAPATP